MSGRQTLIAGAVAGLLVLPTTPAMASPHWQLPLWLEWFAPQPAQVDPLEGKTGGITGPGIGVTVQEGSLSGTARPNRVSFSGGGAPAGAPSGPGLPAFRKPVHPARPTIQPVEPKLAWGNERHPRPPAAARTGGGKGLARTFTPTERPLLTLPSGKEAWNTYRPDGRGTIDIKNPRPGTPKPRWANHLRP
ncbi:hypothetical protein [Stomatohabitans albus]|uniref:hypothetical protein n=1 Tax=Stomatohabitans albus TaxID=3110766 RepID=UPI00300C8211